MIPLKRLDSIFTFGKWTGLYAVGLKVNSTKDIHNVFQLINDYELQVSFMCRSVYPLTLVMLVIKTASELYIIENDV